jgi:hypothetical protein
MIMSQSAPPAPRKYRDHVSKRSPNRVTCCAKGEQRAIPKLGLANVRPRSLDARVRLRMFRRGSVPSLV